MKIDCSQSTSTSALQQQPTNDDTGWNKSIIEKEHDYSTTTTNMERKILSDEKELKLDDNFELLPLHILDLEDCQEFLADIDDNIIIDRIDDDDENLYRNGIDLSSTTTTTMMTTSPPSSTNLSSLDPGGAGDGGEKNDDKKTTTAAAGVASNNQKFSTTPVVGKHHQHNNHHNNSPTMPSTMIGGGELLNLSHSAPILSEIIQQLRLIRSRKKPEMIPEHSSITGTPAKRKPLSKSRCLTISPSKKTLTTTIAIVKRNGPGGGGGETRHSTTKMFQDPPKEEEEEEDDNNEGSEDETGTRFTIKSEMMKQLKKSSATSLSNEEKTTINGRLNNKFIQRHVQRLTKKEKTPDEVFRENYKRFKRIFLLYRYCKDSYMNRPLYLSSSLSYVKYFQKKNEIFQSHHRDQQPDGEDDCSTGDSATTETVDSVESSSGSVDNIVSTALVLDPLALENFPNYNHATIDFYVLRRRDPEANIDTDQAQDSKTYVGTSFVRFGEKSSIINNRIVIPIKLLFELDQIEPNEFIYSSEGYQYFIAGVVTYHRRNSLLESRFQSDVPSGTSKKPKTINKDNDDTVPLKFTFEFELENVQDIHFTEKLSDATQLDVGSQRKRNKIIKGEETHLLIPFAETAFYLKCQCHKKSELSEKRNIVTELKRWNRIESDDVFYQKNPSSRNGMVQFPKHWNCSNSNGMNVEPGFITFRLVRTNMINGDQFNGCKPFNVGKFITRTKLNNVRINRTDNRDGSGDGAGKNTRITRAALGRKLAAGIVNENDDEKQTNLSNDHHNHHQMLNPQMINKKDGFKVLYKFSPLQSHTIMEDFVCPFCCRPFQLLALLAIHLNMDHDRFKHTISLNTKNKIINISVTLNEEFDNIFDNDPLVQALNFKMKSNRPMKRVPVSHVLVFRYDDRTLANMFTYNSDTQQFHVEIRRNVTFEEVTQRRVFYHSRTLMPILPSEINDDSETDDPEWRIKQKRHMMQEFIDVNAGEKVIMALWNEHMMRNRIRFHADCHISGALKEFLTIYTPTIIKTNLCFNCILHLVTLYLCETIDSDDLLKNLIYLIKFRDLYRGCMKALKKFPRTELPECFQSFLRYIEMAPNAIENLLQEERSTVNGDGDPSTSILPEHIVNEFAAMADPDTHLFRQPENILMDSTVMAVLSMINVDNPSASQLIDIGGRQFARHLQRLNHLKRLQWERLIQKNNRNQ